MRLASFWCALVALGTLIACGGSGGGGGESATGGGGGGASPVPGAGPALTPTQLSEVTTALTTVSKRQLVPNPALTPGDRLKRLEDFCDEVRALPNVAYADARYGGGTAAVVLTDGTPLFFVYNRVTNPGGPPVPTSAIARAGVPQGKRLYVHEPLNEPTVDTLIPSFRGRGWTVIHGDGKFSDWQNMTDPGFVFFNGHASKASRVLRMETAADGSKTPIFGPSEWVMETKTSLTVPQLKSLYIRELEAGEMYIGQAEDGEWKIYIGAKSIEKLNLRGAIVYLNSCLSASPVAERSKIPQAFAKAGAQAVFGYTNISGPKEVDGAILVNELMLGTERDAARRPFGAVAAYQEVTRRGLEQNNNWTSFDDEGNYVGLAHFGISKLVLYNLAIPTGDAPATHTTTRLEVVPQPGGAQRLRVHGTFTNGGPDGTRVLVNGADLTLINKSLNLIEAELPPSGIGSHGTVVVIDQERRSFERKLTRWNTRLVYTETTTGEGNTITQKITMPVTVRLDVQGYRRQPNDTPRIDAARGLSLPSDTATFEYVANINGQRLTANASKPSDDIATANIWLGPGSLPKRLENENLYFAHVSHINSGTATTGTLRGTISFLALGHLQVSGTPFISWTTPGTLALGFGGFDTAARIPFEIDLANYQLKGRTWTKTLTQEGGSVRYDLRLEAASATEAPTPSDRR